MAPPNGSHLVLSCGGWSGLESGQEAMKGMWVGPGENEQSAVRRLPQWRPSQPPQAQQELRKRKLRQEGRAASTDK